ncbi:MAG TPA: VCBS repeat-containing protein [Saprospiraceae bacterium]|nr:VCBS repeat-containing protein [Saprospiraceae bacterium]
MKPLPHFFFFILLLTSSCRKDNPEALFTLLDSELTGIFFRNDVPYTEEFNTYTYRNYYNGGGVALGDINNDGLIDIYFTGNLGDNKLYLNKGNWVFEDITEKAGVACSGVWSTGVTMVDINGDGLLDIYVCKAGPPGGANRHNELFINQGNLTFKESAAEYGLDITGLSIHAAFFDYDGDGDLDCYLLSNSLRSVGGFDFIEGQRNFSDYEGNKLLRNDHGVFVDVTKEANIYSSKIGYGLGVTLGDFNGDHWPDIFISNDFFEKDYLYINQGNGTFKEVSDIAFPSMSMGSMGADAADLNNDLLSDIFVTEMLPRDHIRRRSKNVYETWDKYQEAFRKGYHHQYSRNSLHRNIGNHSFLDISRFAGVADTEWSWASLAQDYDNDGLKDLFVSNGIFKDLLDKDYLNYSANETMIRSMIERKEQVLTMLIDSMPSVPVMNCMFKNLGNMQFEMVSEEWGLNQLSFSNGSAYADLDNDGDLDLVVNNVNMPAFVYRNNLDTALNRSIRFKLKGEGMNRFAIGAKIIIKYNGKQAMVENFPSRGFQSSVEPILHFGTGNSIEVDSVLVIWPDRKVTELTHLKTNKTYSVNQSEANITLYGSNAENPKWECNKSTIAFAHEEVSFNLFTRERLLIEMPGFEGPGMAVGDINGDGIDDIFCGGGKNQPSVLFLSGKNGYNSITQPFESFSKSEVVKASFVDIDGDGDLDLYIAHGGKTFSSYGKELDDILMINDGFGNLTQTKDLPFLHPIWTGDVGFADLNRNGRKDIVIVERGKPEQYGMNGSVHILYNQGDLNFISDVPESLKDLGMCTSLAIVDIDNDGYEDLMIAGQWMPIVTALNRSGSFPHSAIDSVKESSGLWNVLYAIDLDGNGQKEIIAGNVGLNSFYRSGMIMIMNDFDNNETIEQIICYPQGDQYYPIHDLDEMYSQMPFLRKKFSKYNLLAKAEISQLFSKDAIDQSHIKRLNEVRSILLRRNGNQWKKEILPFEVQYSSVHAISSMKDGKAWCILLGGNQYRVKPQFGRNDASHGWIVKTVKDNENIIFGTPKPLFIQGEIRAIQRLNDRFAFGRNNDELLLCNIEY